MPKRRTAVSFDFSVRVREERDDDERREGQTPLLSRPSKPGGSRHKTLACTTSTIKVEPERL